MTRTKSKEVFYRSKFASHTRPVLNGKGELEPKDLRVLRLLTKRRLLPRELSDLSGLNLSETLAVIGSLLNGGLIAKMSDGFSSFLYITESGNNAVNGGG
jgi:hypothetical protein